MTGVQSGMLLAGDIGATKTVLGIFSAKAGPRVPLAEATFPSARYPSLEALVREFLGQSGQTVDRASFGVAGPVVSGRAAITNLPWAIDEARLRAALRLTSVRVVNDLDAVARAVPLLEQADKCQLTAGEPVAGGAIAVIAPGTGLGEAFLTWGGSGYRAHPSEGGHADFAPTDARQMDLLRYLQQRFGHVSYERVCSGRGLPNLYAFLKDSGVAPEPGWLAEQLAGAPDPTPVIANAALAQVPCDLCVATLEMFVSILGAEAGNLALKVLATGGVYLGGGMPPHLLPFLKGEGFMRAFRGKGRFADLLGRVPVHVILTPRVGLFGAAAHGLECMKGEPT